MLYSEITKRFLFELHQESLDFGESPLSTGIILCLEVLAELCVALLVDGFSRPIFILNLINVDFFNIYNFILDFFFFLHKLYR